MDPYSDGLASAVSAVVASWLQSCVTKTATKLTGSCPESMREEACRMAERAAPEVIGELQALLEVDADQQRENPLSVLRRATRFPTALLTKYGVPQPARDEFERQHFPDDLYGLSPANWADIDQSLVEPGLIWGAWKAKTILDRRRSEGLR